MPITTVGSAFSVVRVGDDSAENIRWFEDYDTSSESVEDSVHLGISTVLDQDIVMPSNSGIFGQGPESIIKCNSLAADTVIETTDGSAGSKLVLKDFVIDGNKSLGTFVGTGHGLDIIDYDDVYIDNLTVRNCAGHGVRFRKCNRIVIGTLIVHDNEKFGLVFEDAAEISANIVIGKVIAYNNGVTEGYSGINFGDNDATSGPTKINIGEIISHNNGRDGIAFGRNATGGDDGGKQIAFSSMILHNNGDHGVEFFGSIDCHGGTIQSFGNGKHGVFISSGDDGATMARNVQVGQIIAHDNGFHGVYLSTAFAVHLNSVISYNNSQDTTTTYSGISMYAGVSGTAPDDTRNGNIYIGSAICYDDQGTPTQQYGFEIQPGAIPFGHHYVGHLRAYDNVTADLKMSSTFPLHIGHLDVGSTVPDETNLNSDVQLKVGSKWRNWYRTTDGSNTTVLKIPMPQDTVGVIKAQVTGHDSGFTYQCMYDLVCGVRRVGTGNVALLGTATKLHSVETHAGLDATIIGAGDDRVAVRVTGIAGQTIDWVIVAELTEHNGY